MSEQTTEADAAQQTRTSRGSKTKLHSSMKNATGSVSSPKKHKGRKESSTERGPLKESKSRKGLSKGKKKKPSNLQRSLQNSESNTAKTKPRRRLSEPNLNAWEHSLQQKAAILREETNNDTDSYLGESTSSDTDLSKADGAKLLREVEKQKQAASQMRYRDKDELVISLATIDCLIGKLADQKYQDKNYINTFLLSYEYFLDTVKFLKMMINHYRAPKFLQSDGIIDDKSRTFIQLRVINVIKKWIELKYSSLRVHKEWNKLLKNFFTFLVTKGNDTEKHWAEAIQAYVTNHEKQYKTEAANRLIIPHPNPPKNIHLLDADPIALAIQMTLIDHSLFKAVDLSNYYHKTWDKAPKDKRHSGIHPIQKIIQRFNMVSYWVATEIVTATHKRVRSQKIQKFMAVMDHLKVLQNYNGVMQIYSAFNKLAVQRLKKTWKDIPSKSTAIFTSIGKLMSQDHGFRTYRDVLSHTVPPCIPYQGMILGDLFYIEESHDFVEDVHTFVNWEKMTLLATVFGQILRFQRAAYVDIEKKKDTSLLDYIGNISCYETIEYNEDELLRLSHLCETDEDNSEKKSLKKKQTKDKKGNLTFEKIFSNEVLYQKFYNFLKSIYNNEVLLFYKDLRVYKTMEFSGMDQMSSEATRIYDKFVSDDSESEWQVSLSLEVKKEIAQRMKAGQVTSLIFQEAEQEVDWTLRTFFNKYLHKRQSS